MELKIGKKLPDERPKNVYIIECDACHGDGDHEEVVEMEFKNNEKGIEKLKNTIPVLDEMMEYSDNAETDQFDDILGYKEFMNGNWVRDITDDSHEYEAQLCGYKVFFYDKSGDKFEVEVVE